MNVHYCNFRIWLVGSSLNNYKKGDNNRETLFSFGTVTSLWNSTVFSRFTSCFGLQWILKVLSSISPRPMNYIYWPRISPTVQYIGNLMKMFKVFVFQLYYWFTTSINKRYVLATSWGTPGLGGFETHQIHLVIVDFGIIL